MSAQIQRSQPLLVNLVTTPFYGQKASCNTKNPINIKVSLLLKTVFHKIGIYISIHNRLYLDIVIKNIPFNRRAS